MFPSGLKKGEILSIIEVALTQRTYRGREKRNHAKEEKVDGFQAIFWVWHGRRGNHYATAREDREGR